MSWVVKDGCEIRNVYFDDPEMISISAWEGMDKATTMTIRLKVRESLTEDSKELVPLNNFDAIDFDSLNNLVDEEIVTKLAFMKLKKLNKIYLCWMRMNMRPKQSIWKL